MESRAINREESFVIGGIEFFPIYNQLKRAGQTIKIRSGLMKLLIYLVQHRNQVVTREDLLEQVWEGRIISFDSVSRSVSDLRKFLDEQLGNTFKIETIPKVGYKLCYKPTISATKKAPIAPSSNSFWIAPRNLILIVFLVVGAVCGIDAFQRTPTLPVVTKELIYTTSYAGEEITPALSKNGQYQAFSWRSSETASFKIYVQALNANVPRPLTTGEGEDIYPRWQADGQTILFHRWLPNGQRLLMRTSLYSQDEVLIAELPFLDTDGYYTSSTDGNRYFFSAQKDYTTNHSIYQYRADTKTFEKLLETPVGIYGDTYPIFVEEKNAIIFSRSSNTSLDLFEDPDAKHELYIYYLATQKLDLLGSFPFVINGLDWMADKAAILLWLRKSYTNDLLMVDLNKQQVVLKSNVPTVSRNLSYSEETGKVLYEVWQGESGIYQYQIREAIPIVDTEKRLFPSTRSERSLAFSEDGQHLLFNSTRTGFLELWKTEKDKTLSLKKITTNGNGNGLPWFSLSPTGDSILCVFTDKLVLMDRVGNLLQEIIPKKGKIVSPVWSITQPNIIYYSSNETGKFELYEYDVVSKSKRIHPTTDSYRLIPKMENGVEILYYSQFRKRGVWKVNLKTEVTELVLSEAALNDFLNWSPTQNGIYFIRWEGGQSVLYFYSYTTRKYNRLMPVNDIIPGFPSLQISPDEQLLYLTKAGGINADIAVETLN